MPQRARNFWLVADAELIVYGATEPDAIVTIDGRPIQLEPDGTFRFHLSFQDGVINFPIIAVAADGEQTRSVHMTFERQTLQRKTNTKMKPWMSCSKSAPELLLCCLNNQGDSLEALVCVFYWNSQDDQN
jgi:hypothetical protein